MQVEYKVKLSVLDEVAGLGKVRGNRPIMTMHTRIHCSTNTAES